MSVPFRLDTVLRLREVERDTKRQVLASAQLRETILRGERDRVAAERGLVLEDLRHIQSSGHWTAAQALNRQQRAEQLSKELAAAEAALSDITGQLTLRRQELLEADTAVKALEKLATHHRTAQSLAEVARDERERDDIRRPGRAA